MAIKANKTSGVMKYFSDIQKIKKYGIRFMAMLTLFALCYVTLMYCAVMLLVNRHGLLHFLLH
ncbi:hypothetical protein ACLHDD_06705 [Pantoea sp. NSTU24]|uniref:hypothetical protein n=1 Tax=Pantoea sp. NSTU24 TaxID=3391144 RepID=UPI003D008D99